MSGSTTRKARNTSTPRSKKPTAPFTTDDPRAAWKHFRPLALTLDAAALPVCKADPDLVRANAARGVASVAPLAANARRALPEVDVTRALECGIIALALTHAVDLIVGTDATDAPSDDADAALSLNERTAKMFADRQLLVMQLKVFVGLGAFPQEKLTAILEGSGPIDSARDVLTSDAALDGEKLTGRHPFTPQWRAAATKRARRLLAELSPDNAPVETPARSPASIERDAFWALLVAAHAELRKIGMVLFGERDLDAKVPPLQSRTASRATPKTPGDPK